ncbi:hypothetical protein CTP10_R80160 (plasmid) [Cupriavidus sp. P-10]|uniref:hypothetical protein n=1 Tax=unclassified Cupriavidus TaxID=2640874 RepID=UPI000ED653DD|nr:hypothetical protein CTP10_R80160 [Cupriavidus sp. P-10]
MLASTLEGEEPLLLDAFSRWQSLAAGASRPAMLLIPRHPRRFDEVAAIAARTGFTVERRSALEAAIAQPAWPRADNQSTAVTC